MNPGCWIVHYRAMRNLLSITEVGENRNCCWSVDFSASIDITNCMAVSSSQDSSHHLSDSLTYSLTPFGRNFLLEQKTKKNKRKESVYLPILYRRFFFAYQQNIESIQVRLGYQGLGQVKKEKLECMRYSSCRSWVWAKG